MQSTSGTVSLPPYQITLSNFDVGTGNNRLLVVGISANNNNATSVTFGGIPLKQAVSSFHNNDAELWYLANPNGTANVVVTMNGPTSAVVGAYSFMGVDLGNSIPDTAANHSNAASSPTISISTTYQDGKVVDLPSIWGGVTLSSPTCTQAWNTNMPGAITGASSYADFVSPGTITCSWSANSGDDWDDVAIVIKAVANSPTQPQDIEEFGMSGGTPAGGEIQPILAEIINVVPNSLDQIKFQYVVPTSTNNNLGIYHCTDVRLHVDLDGKEVMVTDWLGYQGRQPPLPMDTGIITINSVSPGQHTVTLQPEGRIGGCNVVGYLYSWGGFVNIFDNS